jgi:hypothetical protein
MGKTRRFNLGRSYFNYQSRNLFIQSVWMKSLWLELASEYRLKKETEWELTNDKFQFGEKYVSKQWEDELNKMLEEMLSNRDLESFHPYFADDPIKEMALGFLVTVAGYSDEEGKGEAPFYREKYEEDKNSFYVQSRCFYELSFCYKYFFEIQRAIKDLFGIQVEDCFRDLDGIKESMWYATGTLLAHWHIDDKRKRASKKGGTVQKRSSGILSLVKKIVQDNTQKSYSAERLWRYFEKHHQGRKNAIEIDGFKIYFDYQNLESLEERLFQLSPDGIMKSIGRSAFGGYVKEAKQPSRRYSK